jgi:hypothetical protein
LLADLCPEVSNIIKQISVPGGGKTLVAESSKASKRQYGATGDLARHVGSPCKIDNIAE